VNAAALALQQELQAHSQALIDQMALQPFGPGAGQRRTCGTHL